MSWRDSQVAALEEQAAVIDAAVDAIADAAGVLESRAREQACAELRATTSLLKGEANAIRSEASALQASSSAPLPMSFTTRHVRRRRELEPVDDNHSRRVDA